MSSTHIPKLRKIVEHNKDVNQPKSKRKFNVLDRVRIFKYKNKFDKGFTPKFTN